MADVVIYSSMLCGFCARAKKLLKQKGADFEEIDVLMEPLRRKEMTQKAGGRTSVPQIFINGAHVGGCDDLYALDARGALDPMLKDQAPA